MLTNSEKQWLEQRGKPEGYDGCDFEPEDLYDDIQDIYLEVVFNWPLKGNKKRLESVRRQENFAEASAFRVIEALRDFKEAAEFEARVAAKLATLLDESYFHIDTGRYESCREVCPAHSLCSKGFNPDCRTTFVKYARLKVEEKMDADR